MSERVQCVCCGRWCDEVKGGPTAVEVAQTRRWEAQVLDVSHDGACRAAVVCWECFWKAKPDLWIEPEHWAALKPLVPYEKLPVLDHKDPRCYDVERYSPGG
jgi:hypothetical protein